MIKGRKSISKEELKKLLNQGENDAIEFKLGKGGFPKDFWESYSAFANTNGGLIILGVKESEGRFSVEGLSLEAINKLEQTFWSSVHSLQTTNICLLTNDEVQQIDTGAGFVLVFKIPRATREQRPVYRGQDPFKGTYRRRSSGDYLCRRTEVTSMLSEADLSSSADGRILRGFSLDDIDLLSLEQYRRLFAIAKPDHPWLAEDDLGLMRKLKGYATDRETGQEGLTLAGLLMFGKYASITDQLAHYFPDYKEVPAQTDTIRWTDRICPDGTWEANLFQFYRRVLPKLQAGLPKSFRLSINQRQDYTPGHIALREALANLCVHADYTEINSLRVTKYPHQIVFSNPGTLLISLEQYLEGGESVRRNEGLAQMFMMIGDVEKAGSGVDKIMKGWQTLGWKVPSLSECYQPNKVELTMPMEHLLDQEIVDQLERLYGRVYLTTLDEHERMILAITLQEKEVNHARLQTALHLHKADISNKLKKLCANKDLIGQGHGRGRVYSIPNLASLNAETLQAKEPNLASLNAETLQAKESNLASLNAETLQAKESNLASSVVPNQHKKRLNKEEITSLIIEYCSEWRSVQEIAQYLGRNKNYVRNEILPQRIADGILTMRYPEEVNHPDQQYKVIIQAQASDNE